MSNKWLIEIKITVGAATLAIGMLFSQNTQAVEVAPPHLNLTSTTTIEAYVRAQANASGLGDPLYRTLEHESSGWQNGQSKVPDLKGPNGYEDSWGVCQFHLPSNPNMTREQALDVEYCVQETIREFRAGHQRRWTAYRLLYP